VVLVADGTYTTTSAAVLAATRGGTASNKVVFKSLHKWGAVLSGRNDTTEYGVRIEADYVRVEGFDITGAQGAGIYNVNGDGFELVGNHIHHIARTLCVSDSMGRDGYYSQGTSDVLIDGNQFNDIGRRLSGEGGCSSTPPINHLDHALYMSGTRVMVR